MARSLNRCEFTGNVGKDAEIKTWESGDTQASLSIAVTDTWKDRNGQKQDHTEWVRCVARKGLADVVSKYVHKGDKVFVAGRLRQRKYTGRDGVEKSITEIELNELILLGSGGKRESQQDQQEQTVMVDVPTIQVNTPKSKPEPDPVPAADDDAFGEYADLPF